MYSSVSVQKCTARYLYGNVQLGICRKLYSSVSVWKCTARYLYGNVQLGICMEMYSSVSVRKCTARYLYGNVQLGICMEMYSSVSVGKCTARYLYGNVQLGICMEMYSSVSVGKCRSTQKSQNNDKEVEKIPSSENTVSEVNKRQQLKRVNRRSTPSPQEKNQVKRGWKTELFPSCFTSQRHAKCIHSDNCTCCHTDREGADQTCNLTQSQYTNTGPDSPCIDRVTPDAWQGSHCVQC